MDVTLAHVDRTVSEVPYMTMWQAEKGTAEGSVVNVGL